MENNLLLEINKIKSNMDLPVITENISVLLESATSEVLGKMFDRLFKVNSKSVLKTILSEEEKNLIKRFFKGDIKDELSKVKFSDFMKSPNGVKTIEELKLAVKNARNRRNNPIDDTTETYFNRLINQMEKTKTSWSKKSKVLNKTWNELGGLTTKDVQWLEKVHGKNWAKPFYSFFNSVTRMFESEEKLLTETLNLIKQLSNDKGSENVANYKKQISLNFEKLTKMRRDNFSRINDWITNNVPRDVRTRLDKENLNGYGKAKKLATGVFEKEFNKKWKTFSDRRSEFWAQLKDITLWRSEARAKRRYGGTYEKWSEFRKILSSNTGKFNELKWDVIWGSSLGKKAWGEYITTFGLKSAIIKYAKEYAYMMFMIRATLTIVDYLTDLLGNYSREEDWGWFKSQAESYDKRYYKSYGFLPNSPEGIKQKQELQNSGYYERAIDILKMFKEYAKDNFLCVQAGIPGYLDDILLLVIDLTSKAQHAEPISEEDIKKLESTRDKGEEVLKKTDTIIKEGVKKATDGSVKEKITEITVDNFYGEYPCYESVVDKTYGDRGVKIINANTIELKYKEPNMVYKAELKSDGKLYWENSTTALGC